MESRLLLTQRAQRSLSLAALVFGLCSAFGLPGPGRRAARASSARLFGAMSPAPPVSWPSGAAVASSESVCSVVAASAGVRRVPRRVIKAQQRKGAVRGIRLFRLFRLSRSGLQCPPELAWVGTLQGLSPFRKHLAPFRAVSLMSDCTATSYIKSSVRRCPQPYQDALVRLLWPSHVPALPSGPDSLRLPTGSMREQLGPRCGRRGFLSCSTCNLRGWEV